MKKKKCPNGDNGSILPEKGGGFGSTPDLGIHIEDVNSNLNR